MADRPVDDGWPTHYVSLDGRRWPRIAYGNESVDCGADRHPCRDCLVVKGEYHVSPICEVEQCPCCGGQFVSCDCDFVGDDPGESDADPDAAEDDS
jgi:hypothetical protein